MALNEQELLAKAEGFLAGKNPSPLLVAVDNTNTINHNQQVVFELEKRIALGDTIPLHTAYNMLHTNALSLQHRKKIAELYGMATAELKQAFAGLERANKISEALGSVPDNEYGFVDSLMTKWETVMTFQKIYTINTPYVFGDNVIHEAELADFEKDIAVFVRSADPKRVAFGEMLAKVIKANAELKMGYNETQIIRAFEDWTNTQRNIIVANTKKEVTFNPRIVATAEIEWDKLVNAITDVNVDESKAVLKHFIWQVKRKMFGKRVDKHMMPVLNGLQEIGKSTIVNKLVKPIEDFAVITNFKAITDERSHELWKNYVLILDEMGNSTQSNLEEIKQKITSDSFSGRLMRTNSDTVIVNHATMIGTTNKHLSTLIYDDSGMRRFFQIECKTAFDRDVINKIDYLMLWQSIDEEKDTALVTDNDLSASIRNIQSITRFRSPIEEFFRQRKYSKGPEIVLSNDLYDEFKKYEDVHDEHAHTSHGKFSRSLLNIPARIQGLHIEKLKRSSKGERYEIAKTIEGEFE